MKSILRGILFGLWMTSHILAAVDLNPILPQLKNYIQKSMKDWELPGATVGIVQDGKVVFLESYGVTKVGTQQPMNNQTIYPLSSLSKTFLTFLVGQMIDEKKVSLDDPMSKLLKEFTSEPLQNLKLVHVFSHTTGFESFSMDTLGILRYSQKEILDGFNKLTPESHPGQIHHYQNMMLGVVGNAIERIEYKKLESIVQERFFTPLQLTRTFMMEPTTRSDDFGLWDKITSNFKRQPLLSDTNAAASHDFDFLNKKTVAIPHSTMMYSFPGTSGIHSCGDDMAKWTQFLLNGNDKIVSKTTHQLIFEPRTDATSSIGRGQFTEKRFHDLKCSLGFFVGQYGSEGKTEKVIMLPAGVLGTRSLIWLIPDQKIGIFILSNLGGRRVSFYPEGLAFWLMDRILDLKENHNWSKELHDDMYAIIGKKAKALEEDKNRHPKPARPSSDYVGTYQHGVYGKMNVSVKSDSLYINIHGANVPLIHHNGNKFSFHQRQLSPNWGHNDFGMVEFIAGDNGKTEGVFINILFEGNDNLFHRVQNQKTN